LQPMAKTIEARPKHARRIFLSLQRRSRSASARPFEARGIAQGETREAVSFSAS
jgi:hypothetical protein